jgi:hypothetical protein
VSRDHRNPGLIAPCTQGSIGGLTIFTGRQAMTANVRRRPAIIVALRFLNGQTGHSRPTTAAYLWGVGSLVAAAGPWAAMASRA